MLEAMNTAAAGMAAQQQKLDATANDLVVVVMGVTASSGVLAFLVGIGMTTHAIREFSRSVMLIDWPSSASRGEGTAGRLLTDRELYDRLNSMSARLDKVMTGLEQGDGTAGQLLRDKQLYENMNGAVGELRKLVQDIRADPRKFLNVRVSLF